MSTNDSRIDLATSTELDKLAVDIPMDDDLRASLATAGARNIRHLREALVRAEQAPRRAQFKRLATAVAFLPTRYVARVAEEALSPLMAARIVSVMNPVTGSRIAKRLSPQYLAAAATAADPVAVRDIIPLIPATLIRDVAMLLLEREDYVTMGRFADALSAPAIRLVVNATDDDSQLLKIAQYMEQPRQLGKIVMMLDNDRVARVIQTGMAKHLWPQALWVIDHVAEESKGRLADIMGAQPLDTLNDLVEVAYKERLWAPVLRAMAHMNPRYYRKIVNLPALHDETILGDLVATAYEEGLLATALPLARVMRPHFQRTVAHAALDQGDDVAEAALWAAHNSHRWDVILELARHLDDDKRNILARLPIAKNPQALRSLLETAAGTGHMDLLLDFARRFDDDGLRLVIDIGLEDSGDLIEAFLDAAQQSEDGWAAIVTALSAVTDEDTLKTMAPIYQRQDAPMQQAFQQAASNGGIWDRIAPALGAA
ncbi:MAG: hypothetical protein ABF296_02890 [Oceanococcaceae bacterium]